MASFFSAPVASAPPVVSGVGSSATLVGASHGTSYCLSPSITISENTSEVFAVKFSPDGKFLAACCGDGAIRVFNSATGRLAYNLQKGSSVALPSTAVKFRPDVPSVSTKNVFVSADALGCVEHWHMTSGKCLHTLREENNQVLALDFRPDALFFATAGKDTCVRIYDEQTRQLVTRMERGVGYGPLSPAGHSNRVFSVKFHPQDPHVLLSGGWDNTVQVWDTRTGLSQRSIFGPHLCGDALDVQGSTVLTGSWRGDEALELWDYGTGSRVAAVDWFKSEMYGQACMLYAAQFSKDGYASPDSAPAFIAAGGSGANEARVFDVASGNCCVGSVTGLSRGIFTVDWSPTERRLAVAGGDASIRIIDVVDKKKGGGKAKATVDGVEEGVKGMSIAGGGANDAGGDN